MTKPSEAWASAKLASISSACSAKKEMAALKPDQMRPFTEQLIESILYMHGTYVAGIAMDGNPYARLAVARITFDYKLIPDPCPSRQLAEREAAADVDDVGFFKGNHVRVVNMSWGGSVKDYEDGLERCGIGKSVEERKQMAREMFDIGRRHLINPKKGRGCRAAPIRHERLAMTRPRPRPLGRSSKE